MALICAAGNMLTGLGLLAVVNRSPRLRVVFYDDPGRRGGELLVGCLWLLPVSFVLIGLITWALAVLLSKLPPQ